jgi:hypothetical protein
MRLCRKLYLPLVLLGGVACSRTTSEHAILLVRDLQIEKGCGSEVVIDDGLGTECRFSRERAGLLGRGDPDPPCTRTGDASSSR